ncbi:unnamed protein product, partial [Amoebophrya sp. A120]
AVLNVGDTSGYEGDVFIFKKSATGPRSKPYRPTSASFSSRMRSLKGRDR